MVELRLERFAAVGPFLEATGAFLATREAEHNLLLGITATLTASPDVYREPPYLAAVYEGDQAVLVALRTPPWNLVLSEVDRPAAVGLLVEDAAQDLARRRPAATLRGVLGPVEHAAEFARCWSERTGQAARLALEERIFRLTRVIPPRPIAGRLRAAGAADRELLLAWLRAFSAEALGDDDPGDPGQLVERWLAGGARAAYLWDDGGPVSLAAVGGPTPHGCRVGPVYTPPELRSRGYASACVAAATQLQLDRGRQFVFLFTDLANPTANHIYEAIGYEPVRDVADWRFGP
jgi:hypothetical protein